MKDGENMIHKRMSIALGSAALLAFIAPACSSDSKSSTTTVAGAPAVSTATGNTTAAGGSTAPGGSAGLGISGFQFSGGPFTAGTDITITNSDGAGHTVTDDGGKFDVAVPAGGTATLTALPAGTYSIHCRIHAAMKGTITVA
jgi:plastocyanin